MGANFQFATSKVRVAQCRGGTAAHYVGTGRTYFPVLLNAAAKPTADSDVARHDVVGRQLLVRSVSFPMGACVKRPGGFHWLAAMRCRRKLSFSSTWLLRIAEPCLKSMSLTNL